MKPKISKIASRFTLHCSLLFCSLLTVHCSLNAQQVIYIDISNNTGNEDGSVTHPFNTILEGLGASENNDSIAIAAGTYQEDTLLIEKCVSVAGNNSTTTIVNGIFIVSSKLDTLPILICNLRCKNINHNDSGYTQTPLTIMDCRLQTLNDYTPSVSETGRTIVKNCIATDSIHIESVACAAKREVVNCQTEGGLWISCSSSQGNIRVADNYVGGCLRVNTISKSDTVFITGNQVTDSLVLLSVASDPDVISNNSVGSGIRMQAVAHSGFQMAGNLLQNGSLLATCTALSESKISNNYLLNGGINFKAVAGDIYIEQNEIHTDGNADGIRLKTTAGGFIENNAITLPYSAPSGLPFEDDTISVCGINVHATSFGGMHGNLIHGGVFAVYLSAIASNDFVKNEIDDAHYGLYLRTVSGYVDSNKVEYCVSDGMILDYPKESYDTNAIYLNHNTIQNNGGHGIWTNGNALMGNLKDPGTGFNIIKNNGGYDLYVETLSGFVDTIWAQNNEWSHSTEEEVGLFDIFDATDDPSKALVMYTPLLTFGVSDLEVPEIVLYPNPTRGQIKVQGAKFNVEFEEIEVVDLYGEVLETWNAEPGTQELDLGTYPAGIYFIKINIENQTIMKKIIKL